MLVCFVGSFICSISLDYSEDKRKPPKLMMQVGRHRDQNQMSLKKNQNVLMTRFRR